MAPPLMGKICFLMMVGVAACGYCMLDAWNHNVITDLFGITQVKNEKVNPFTGEVTGDVSHPFNYPVTLAFFQFLFVGVVLLGFWYLLSRHPAADVAGVRENIFQGQWVGLVATHVFSVFWLQSLMMPATLMTPMVFAGSRALEIPAVAAIRSKVIGGEPFARFGGHPPATIALMFLAGTLLVFSQTRLADCLCMWSGHGVELAGVALFLIYALLLILPAANAVFMESVMVKFDTNPLLMLSVMNLLASVCFAPIVVLAHCMGWENVMNGIALVAAQQQLYMLVIWLCTQMVLLSVVTVALINMTDSFWAVSLRSLKAVLWWMYHLGRIFFLSSTVLSIDHPNMSFWGFIMLAGVVLVIAAASIDANSTDTIKEAKTRGEHV